jgi:hypothetical protein
MPQDLTDCRKVASDENATVLLSHLTKMEEELAATVLAQQYLIAELQEKIKTLEEKKEKRKAYWNKFAKLLDFQLDTIGYEYFECVGCSKMILLRKDQMSHPADCTVCGPGEICRDCNETKFCWFGMRCYKHWNPCMNNCPLAHGP